MTQPYLPSARTTPSRSAQRVSYDRETVHAVLDEAIVCHVGFVVQGRPVVLPHLHARIGDPEDLGLPYWAGVLPLVTSPGTPQPDGDLTDRTGGVAIPAHVTDWKRPQSTR